MPSWSTPRTFTTGEVLTAANLNTYVSDDLAYLKGILTGVVGQKVIISETGLLPLTVERTENTGALRGHIAVRRNGVDKAYIGLTAADAFAILDSTGGSANLTITDAGAVTTRTSLTVTTGGMTVTGDSTITGALTATGLVTGRGFADNAGGAVPWALLYVDAVRGPLVAAYMDTAGNSTKNAAATKIEFDNGFRIYRSAATTVGAARSWTQDFAISTAGAVSIASGLTITTGNLAVSAGSATIASGLTITSGGITVTAGGVAVTAGGVTVNAGSLATGGTSTGIALTAGNFAMSSNGYVDLSGGTLLAGTSTIAIKVQNTWQSTAGASMLGLQLAPTITSGTVGATQALMRMLVSNPTTANVSWTITDFRHVHITNVSKGASNTITTQYGILIDAMTAGGTNYALYTNAGLVVFGDAVTIASGGLTVTGGITASTVGITVTAGGLTINGGNLTIASAGYFTMAGGTLLSSTSTSAFLLSQTLESVGGTSMSSIVASPTVTLSSGTMNAFNVFQSSVSTANVSFTITDFAHYRVVGINKGASNTITNEYGLLIDNIAGGTNKWAIKTGTGTVQFGDGLQMGTPTGGNKGAGTINVATDIYKNNAAYTNPHGGFEYAYTGKVERFADRMAAMRLPEYRPLSLTDLEAYTRDHFHFPYFGDDQEHGLFSGSERLLLMTEELAVHLFELNRRVGALERKE